MHQPIDDKQQLANVRSILRRLQNSASQPQPDPDANDGFAITVDASAIPPAPPIDATPIYFSSVAGASTLAARETTAASGVSQQHPSKLSWAIVAASLTLLAGGAWLGTKPPAGTVNTSAKPALPETARAAALTEPPATEVANTGSATQLLAGQLGNQMPQPGMLDAAPFAPPFARSQAASPRQSRSAPPTAGKKTAIVARRYQFAEPVKRAIARVTKTPVQTFASLSSKTLPGAAITPPPAIAPLPALAPLPLRR